MTQRERRNQRERGHRPLYRFGKFDIVWRNPLAVAAIITLGFLGAWLVVYYTGGTKYAHLHVVYVPILLSAFRFNVLGGGMAGIVGALLMGPLMPLDVALGEAQPLENWLSRGGYLTAFGVVIGLLHAIIMKNREELYRIINYDLITNLPLFESFRREVRSTLAEKSSDPYNHTIINLVIANSDDIHSSFGAELHEKLIRACAQRLREVLPEGSFIARGSQTRFLALIKNIGVCDAVRHGHALLNAFNDGVIVQGLPIQTDVEVGLACFPEHGEDTEELVRASHSALSDIPAGSRRVHVFSRKKDELLRQNLEILSELGSAISGGEMSFFAQPKMRLDNGTLAGAELLARWVHPQRGFIPPDHFIPVAEKSRLIHRITNASFGAANDYVQATRAWSADETFRIAVNVSGEDIADASFPSRLALAFRERTQMLNQLEIEITETAVIDDFSSAIPVLEALQEMGVRIAIDDFGTGYSSLRYLKDIPANALKIDQSFVKKVLTSEKDAVLVRHTIDLAKDLGLECIAEGVETAEIENWLLENDCDIAQGYWYAKPMPPSAWDEWLKTYVSASAGARTEQTKQA